MGVATLVPIDGILTNGICFNRDINPDQQQDL